MTQFLTWPFIFILSEVLTRDRLLGMYETKPVLQKLRVTLIGSGVILFTSAALLFGIIRAEADEDGMYGRGSSRIRNQQVGVDVYLPGDQNEWMAFSHVQRTKL